MARYIDGFVLPVPKKNLKAYTALGKKMAKIFLANGALEWFEYTADDVKPGKLTSFPQSVKLKANETVIFSWVVYKSRAHRDRVMKKSMKDPLMAAMGDMPMPFDGKRMIYGGFKSLFKLKV